MYGEDDFSIPMAISGDEKLDFRPLIVTKLTNFEEIIEHKKNDTLMREIPPLPVYAHPANASSSNVNAGVEQTDKYQHKDTKMREILPLALSTQPENSSSSNVTEYILEEAFQKQETHGFYCPKCRACIDKVIVQQRGKESKERVRCTTCFSFLTSWVYPNMVDNEVDGVSDDEGICNPVNPLHDTTSVPEEPSTNPPLHHPVGNTIPGGTGDPVIPASRPTIDASNDPPTHHSVGNTAPGISKIPTAKPPSNGSEHHSTEHTLLGVPKNPATKPLPEANNDLPHHSAGHTTPGFPTIPASKPTTDTNVPASHHPVGYPAPGVHQNPAYNPTTATNDPPYHHSLEIPEEQGQTSVHGSRTDGHTSQESPTQESGGGDRTLEVLKSVVYGGLVESIASLGVVTSAASSDTKTLNIITLAVANLISGLFVLVSNLWELKPNQPLSSSNDDDAKARKYQELLGYREHFLLHSSLAILSFLIFGLVPPVLFGFSFQKSDDKDLKLVAVAGASFLCIILLAIAKAYTNKSKKIMEYFKTVVYYVSISAVASVVAYLAGKLVKQVLKNLGWFESGQTITNLALGFPRMSTQSHAWESY